LFKSTWEHTVNEKTNPNLETDGQKLWSLASSKYSAIQNEIKNLNQLDQKVDPKLGMDLIFMEHIIRTMMPSSISESFFNRSKLVIDSKSGFVGPMISANEVLKEDLRRLPTKSNLLPTQLNPPLKIKSVGVSKAKVSVVSSSHQVNNGSTNTNIKLTVENRLKIIDKNILARDGKITVDEMNKIQELIEDVKTEKEIISLINIVNHGRSNERMYHQLGERMMDVIADYFASHSLLEIDELMERLPKEMISWDTSTQQLSRTSQKEGRIKIRSIEFAKMISVHEDETRPVEVIHRQLMEPLHPESAHTVNKKLLEKDLKEKLKNIKDFKPNALPKVIRK
jgi:hypothetical protein